MGGSIMKRIIKAVCSVIVSTILLAHSFIAYAIDFDAEQTFDSVFVVLSEKDIGAKSRLPRIIPRKP